MTYSDMSRAAAIVILSLAALVGAASGQAASPVAFIRDVSGTARIIAAKAPQVPRPAEPFVTLFEKDIVEVESGSLVLFDLSAGSEQRLGAPSRFVVHRAQPAQRATGMEAIIATLARIVRQPDQMVVAGVRGDEVQGRAWPAEGMRFAAGAQIKFLWEEKSSAKAERLRLLVPHSAGPQVYAYPNPSNPMAWPESMPRIAGHYQWEVRAQGRADPIAFGAFEIMDEATLAGQRALYRQKATERFPENLVEVGMELLAAQDGCFLR